MPGKISVPLSSVLDALSGQLDALSEQTSSLEDAVSPHVNAEGNLPDQIIWELQGLDWIRQSLADLSILTALLAKETSTSSMSPEKVKSTCKSLSLSSTRNLLSPTLENAGRPMVPGVPTDVQLF